MLFRIFGIVLVYFLWRALLGGIKKSQPKTPARSPDQWLVKDPVCNTYLPQKQALTLKSSGETIYFCSDECRRKYPACII